MATHLIAALLCSAITSRREARAVRELHRAASRVLAADRSTASQRAAAQESAERLWDLVAAQPEGERVPVLVASRAACWTTRQNTASTSTAPCATPPRATGGPSAPSTSRPPARSASSSTRRRKTLEF